MVFLPLLFASPQKLETVVQVLNVQLSQELGPGLLIINLDACPITRNSDMIASVEFTPHLVNKPAGVVPVDETLQSAVRMLYTKHVICSAVFYREPANALWLWLWAGFRPDLSFEGRLAVLLDHLKNQLPESLLTERPHTAHQRLSANDAAEAIKQTLNQILANGGNS